jgi:replicative DNA helicase
MSEQGLGELNKGNKKNQDGKEENSFSAQQPITKDASAMAENSPLETDQQQADHQQNESFEESLAALSANFPEEHSATQSSAAKHSATKKSASSRPFRSASSSSSAKLPPHSRQAEQSVLGALLVSDRAWDEIVDRLKLTDFYFAQHQYIFEAMHHLAAKHMPFDVLTVSEALKNYKKLDLCGGEVYLFELANNTPSAANVKAYADIVRDHSILRQLIHVGSNIAQSSYDTSDNDSKSLLEMAESQVFAIAQSHARGTGPVDLASLLVQATERIDNIQQNPGSLTGAPTGYNDLDEMTSGLQDGELIIVAGRPSMGKTAFSMNIAEHVAIKGDKPVLVFSLEMPGDALAMRMLSSLGRIDQQAVRNGALTDDDWPRLTSAVSMLSQANMFIDDTPALSPIEMRARARRVAREHGGIGLIVVDYLQLMQMGSKVENRTAEISQISRSLKGLAKELNCPVIAASQLNRSLEQRQDKRPVMSDLRESGAIEQDADLIAFIYRDEVYNEDTPFKGTAEIIIAKQRNGPIGRVRLTFLGRYTRFENYTQVNSGVGQFMEEH